MRTRLAKGLLTIVLVLGLLLPGCAIFPQGSGDRAQTLASDIQVLEQRADERGRVTVVIKLEGALLAGIEENDVVEKLKRQATQSQKKVLEWLKTRGATVLNTFWLSNAILAEVPVDMLDEFVSLTKVERLFENFEITIPEPLEEESLPAALAVNCTWGLEKIHVPEVWDMNITGSGVQVAVLDTGVNISHPDLAGKMWTDNPADPTYPGGWIEFNSYGNIVIGSGPHDTDDHGTHTSGTCVGGNTSGIAIGVAPGAFLMHGLVLPGGSGTYAQIIAGMEWCTDPVDQYDNPAGEPADVISMSLGATGYYDAFIEPVQNIKAAGIVLIASIGNSGEGTSGSPGNVYEAFGIGATDIDDEVASFSSGEVVDWPASYPEPYIKPDFSAPGVSVYSSVPGGEYEYLSGTSMAAPHVAGTVALMVEGNPALTVEDVYDVLYETAVDLGDIWQDTRYGWGRIDASEAVSLVTLESGIEGLVTDAETEEPLEGVEISISDPGRLRYTDGSGYYRSFLPPGTYNVTASAYGYYQGNATVEVVEDAFSSQNFTLEPVPTGFIEGTVTDVETDEPVEGAIITLLDTPLSTATNETGQYSMEALIGTYNVSAWTWGYRKSVIPDVIVAENETVTVNFTLEPVLAVVAVLGDYESQLNDLLIANDIWAEERDWDIIDDIFHYDAVVVNQPDAPGASAFLEFLEAASDNQVGVVFTDSYGGGGISLLRSYLGDPAGRSYDSGDGNVSYQVEQANPLLEGWGEGDNITIITGGGCDHAWFSNYSGCTIAAVGSENQGVRGDAVALGAYGESLHILLASLAPQSWTNVPDWTEDARTILVRGVLAAGGLIDVGVFVGTRELPLAVVGEEYQATLKAVGGTKPYTWAIINGTLPDGLGLDGNTGVISGIPTEAGTCNFTVEVTDAAEAAATRELSISIIVWTELITDPVGDQFSGYGPDIVGADFYLDNTPIYFRGRTAEAIDPNDTLNYMFLDLDLNAQTGFVSDDPLLPTNDIGADAVAIVLPTSMAGEELPLPIHKSDGEQPLEAEAAQASSTGLTGQLYVWLPIFGGVFWYAGDFPVSTGNQSFLFSIPLDMLGDDGVMSVVDVIGDSSEPTDVAPNEGHGITGEGPDLVIVDKSEIWLNQDEGTYIVGYVVKNQGNVAVPAGHEMALTVDEFQVETKPVPVALAPGQEYSGSFSTIVTISPSTDEIIVCADFYSVVDELSEENNCLANTWVIEPAWTSFITDPVGDQFEDYGPDIVGADFYLDNTTICFRVRTAEPIDPDFDINEMFLDLDRKAWTGFVSEDPDGLTNDIGADAAALIFPASWLMGEELPLPLQVTSGELQLESVPSQASSQELLGILALWDPDYEEFYEAGSFPVFTGNQSFWFAIPLDMLEDDGYMNVVDVIGDLSLGFTDVAPNTRHGSTRTGCFIATAAYGTDTAKEIDILREFRDAVLLPNSLGARLVSFYYKASPPVANFISQHEVLRTVVRMGFVDPIVRILTWTHALW
ncbi:MAG: S8 family serine peptidase [Dehalococcoidia bacterium]|nr:S8 family serine peptidase [Dehalococcoidia bacterium]